MTEPIKEQTFGAHFAIEWLNSEVNAKMTIRCLESEVGSCFGIFRKVVDELAQPFYGNVAASLAYDSGQSIA